MDRPVILCGLGLVGWRVLEHLRAFGHPIVCIDTKADPDDPRLRGENVRLVIGDCRRQDVLERAGVASARGVLILTSQDLLNISAALLVRRLNPHVRIVVRMFNRNLVSRLDKAVHNTTALSVSALAAPRMARRALASDVQTVFQNAEGGVQHVVELPVGPDSPLCGLTIGEVHRHFGLLSVAHQSPGAPPRLLLNLDSEAKLAPGDRLTVAAPPEKIDAARAGHLDLLYPAVRWAGKLRRYCRMVKHTLLEVDLSVKIAGAVLAAVLLFSTVAYHYYLEMTWADSVYNTVAVMTTEEAMGGDEFQGRPDAESAKLFVVFLKMMGVLLVAGFTAIFTNFLIRARLDRALEVRRIPEGGHVVVCGLGNVGFRIVEELLAAGEKVVVIEQSPTANFVATCRRQGVAVIAGDATVPEVLRQARAPEARAVIAATSNELTNLEIALLVNELNPRQPVVVRLSDPLLAETLREAANVPLAVSIPALSAPAFVAALFEDRVQTVFRVGEQEMVVVDLVVDASETNMVGQSLRAVATDYNLIPVGLTGADPHASRDSATYRLRPGDRLTVFTTARDLGRLVQREAVPADWAVEVTACPPASRPALALMARTALRLGREEAEALAGRPPFRLAEKLTRGQAEHLLRQLQREKIDGRLVRVEAGPPTP